MRHLLADIFLLKFIYHYVNMVGRCKRIKRWKEANEEDQNIRSQE
jgi:hypothetical protein